ncbi:uncharacterized protein LOC143455306 [Clavelina lepadiformis]|uniref:uncharacterized protein LOC143455306 n=1 Tax=Clavelina lepadiformis TaxID=159417 RepID=UPI004042CF35
MYSDVWSLLLALLLLTLQASSTRSQSKRQAIQCTFQERRYSPGDKWSFEVGSKTFDCTCSGLGTPNCEWRSTQRVQRRCYDRFLRRYHTESERWESRRGGRTYDCSCERNHSNRMQIVCSGENRCHHQNHSYRRGDQWKSSDITGLVMDCQCLGAEKVTCRASVTTEVPRPAVDAQWVNDHIVYGKQVLRPRIATLQACDTGTRVVSSGYTWNKTAGITADGHTMERCECRDALIRCEPYLVSRNPEPHCLTVEGQVKYVGERWTRVHHTHSNIRYRCHCRGHGEKDCQDIGYCDEPSPPSNGAIVCVVAGRHGSMTQSHYCMPLCAQGYDFLNRQRYYRIWDVCGRVTNHRWSAGYADDPLLIAKCRRPDWPIRGRRMLYLPTEDCTSLSDQQIEKIKQDFIQLLYHNNLCRNKCQTKFFRCGARQ